MSEPLLRVNELVKNFPVKGGVLRRTVDQVHAVDHVSFEIGAGETLGLVGESGCGKSTTGRCILRLIEPTAGEIWFEGRNVIEFDHAELSALRRDMQIIFQDPYASLNPRMTIGAIIGEALTIHGLAKNRQRLRGPCGRTAGDGRAECRPHAALSARVLRRPASAHRHRARARGVAEADRVRRAGLGARRVDPGAGDQSAGGPAGAVRPDLSVHRARSVGGGAHQHARRGDVSRPDRGDRAARDLYDSPLHPYTEALLSAVPIPDPTAKRQRIRLQGDVPNPIRPPSGCHFHTRCPIRELPLCSTEKPPLRQTAAGHWVACHLRG